MDQLDDDREVDVTRADGARGRTGEKRKRRAQPFAAAAACVSDISFNRRVESSCLFADSFLDRIEMRINQLNGLPPFYCAEVMQSRFCENFHEQSLVGFSGMVNQSPTEHNSIRASER